MSSVPLTTRQQTVLDCIRQYQDVHGAPPTQAELAEAMGFRSRTAAKDHLKALERKGYIRILSDQSRGIRLLEPAQDRGLPLVGKVAAGVPILAVENIESTPECDPGLFHPRADYLLRVQGWSMRDVGIADGDLLAVQKTPTAENGEIIIARLDDEVTVKTLRRDGDSIWLDPAHPDFQSRRIHPERDLFVIEGRMVGLIRPRAPSHTDGS